MRKDFLADFHPFDSGVAALEFRISKTKLTVWRE